MFILTSKNLRCKMCTYLSTEFVKVMGPVALTMGPADVRTLRAVEPSLAGYLRPFKRDCSHLAHLLAEGLPVGAGVVLDPTMASESEGLREQARTAGLEVVLDPKAMELATPGGFARKNLKELPWAGLGVHSPEDFLAKRAPSLVNDWQKSRWK